MRLLPDGGAVNKVGLYNPGIREWCWNIGPYLNYGKYPIMASIFGSTEELVFMTEMLNRFHLVGIEVNYSCPNTQDHPLSPAEQVIDAVKAVKKVSEHPVIVKISVDQDYLAISRGLVGIAEAISINSVPWKTAFPDGRRSLLWELEKKVGGGGGGVSGRPAQVLNWKAVRELAEQGSLPVIAPSIMEFGDMERVRKCGAKAVSFGTIHLRTPLRPTQIVRKEMGIWTEWLKLILSLMSTHICEKAK